jgi:cytochrome c
MKKLKLSLVIATFFTLVSCGEKKTEDSFGKPTSKEEKEVVVDVATSVDAASSALAEKGKDIFEGKGTCVACHQPSAKTVGPSLQDIAKIYNEKNGNIVVFLKGESDPIVDPAMFEVMKANFAITKVMSDEELNSLEAYIQSYLN